MRRQQNITALWPLLNRLLDEEVTKPDDYAAVVLRDLEALLNTRAVLNAGHEDESTATVLEYGLADFTAEHRFGDGLFKLALDIKSAIAVFEPRLKNVAVEPRPDISLGPDRLLVRITATLSGHDDEMVMDLPLELKPAPVLR